MCSCSIGKHIHCCTQYILCSYNFSHTGWFFSAGGFIIPYAKAKEINEKYQPMYQTLAVSFVNGVSLFGAFWVPLLFSGIARHSGYSMAWMLGSLLTLVLVIPLIRQKL